MPENGMPGPVCDLSSVREAVCIHTHKIFDLSLIHICTW